MVPTGPLRLFAEPLPFLPEVRPGDDLGRLIATRSRLQAGDVLVVAQKIVSKSEGRLVDLQTVTAGDEALRIAMGGRGRVLVENRFGWNRVAVEMEALYTSCSSASHR